MEEPSNPAVTKGPQKTSIRIGDVDYNIDISKIPYLSSFARFETKSNHEQAERLVLGPIPQFEIVLKGLESGYRQCFRALPAELAQHQTLCESYDFLGVDVLEGKSFDEIFTDVKAGRSDYEKIYKRCYRIKGNKSRARDASFQLLYLILLGQFKDEIKDSAKVFNAVLFVVSHPGTFKLRARTVIRAAFESRFILTEKQKARLNQWEKDIAAKQRTESDDGENWYDSDCSY